ncbi:MAG: hypothetical protein QOF97_2572 [Acidimicrobiaceae bacterium]
MTSTVSDVTGVRGRIAVRHWHAPAPRYLVALAHGIAEHSGRYEHIGQYLAADGAEVAAPDHWGHGRSDGQPGLVDDVEALVTDLGTVADQLKADHAEFPLVVIGHSLGGIVATRFVQRNPGRAAALVLSGPVIGGNDLFLGLLDLPEIPDIPIDPTMLSRDPAVGEAYAADPLVYHGPLLRQTLQGVQTAVDAIAEGGSLGDLPTLWLHGELDPLAPLAEATRAFDIIGGSALQTKVYPGAMHEIFNETNAADVLNDINEFLHAVLG